MPSWAINIAKLSNYKYFNKMTKSKKKQQATQLGIGDVIGRFLCKIGLHKWEEGFSGSMISPLAHKCKRCKIVRVFHGWGYTYGRDANDL